MKEVTLTVEIDGNDGVGKTFIINMLSSVMETIVDVPNNTKYAVVFKDRGALTVATDKDNFTKEENHIYILLDASIEWCQRNILKRGDSIEEKYHTVEDLTYYRKKFLDLAYENNIPVIPIEEYTTEETVKTIIQIISDYYGQKGSK